MKVALINTNRMQPPIAPIGLDYVAEALNSAGHSVEILDLCWEANPLTAISGFLSGSEFGLIGMTLRNTDDCAFMNCQSFLPPLAEYAKAVRENTEAPIMLGGVGFSVMPERILTLTNANFGIWGEGEFAAVELARRLEKQESWENVPNLLWRKNGGWMRNSPVWGALDKIPAMTRRWVDNPRYFREGGQAGFETKRGCSAACIYCADPQAKGKQMRFRPPAAVADELRNLLRQGIDALHTCDGEFNVPEWHALEMCAELTRCGLGKKIRWYAYCSPGPFSLELARAMRNAGCAGIDFGADNGNEEMLRRLGRDFGPADILNAIHWAKEEGMAVMLDLLFGAPGETRESIEQTIELVKQSGADLAGVSLGVRVFPGTELDAQVGGGNATDPFFYLEPAIASQVFDWLNKLIGEDRRFLFFDPTKPKQNYNYNANQRLIEAIRNGRRGAFWDILRSTENSI